MKQSSIEAIEHCVKGSHDGSLSFPEAVAQLAAAGVSHYHADFLRQENTFYLTGGDSRVTVLPVPPARVAPAFNAEEMAAAVKASQIEGQSYSDFLKRAFAAGCIGYVVYIEGRRVVYTGWHGEAHIEHFPGAKRQAQADTPDCNLH